ncbi:putative E3 ubiquitin-protein ligase XBAT35 [Mercurialis annua]|uniref:putative E3 ubiquitin-protein ligase XBAT35 n=1 Tax=Mercurialis annua TaxID=3986 RepID=UPI002160AF90|nr:putative E3 ubiquitin-protein ligase XBAT35 [Mercurialis annua]
MLSNSGIEEIKNLREPLPFTSSPSSSSSSWLPSFLRNVLLLYLSEMSSIMKYAESLIPSPIVRMGQSICTLMQDHSKQDLLHQLVKSANVDAIKAICTQHVNLEWTDKEGKTALVLACMEPELFNVAKTLIQLGANVNAYRPGRHAGTPLHHASRRGLHQTVLLLLANGANALVRNDDFHTALVVARINRHVNVVRAIENHICLFSGWLRKCRGPGFLGALFPQLLSRKIWVVIIPSSFSDSMEQTNLVLVIYTTLQDAQPHTIIPLSRAKIKEPKFNQSDPRITICDNSTRTKTRYRFGPCSDKEQLRRLYDACRGFRQNIEQTSAEALDLLMARSAHIRSAPADGPPLFFNGERYIEWALAAESSNSEASSIVRARVDTQTNAPVAQTRSSTVPSAPPMPHEWLI